MPRKIKNTVLFKTINLFLILTFFLSVIPEFAESALAVTLSEADEVSRVEGHTTTNLSTLLKFGFSGKIIMDEKEKQNLNDWFKDISKKDVLDKIREAIGRCITQYLDKMKDKMISELDEKDAHAEWMKVVENDKIWETIFSDFLGKYVENFGETKIPGLVRERIKEEFDSFRTRARENAGSATRTPGIWYARTEKKKNTPLNLAERKAMDRAIEETIKELKEKIAKKLTTNDKEKIQNEFKERYSCLEVQTGMVFIVLPDDVYNKYAREFNAPLDVECHPGTRGTREQYEKYGDLSGVKKFSYIRKSTYDLLSESEKVVLARHELKHVECALGIKVLSADELTRFGSEEGWINSQRGCDIRPIMARISVIQKEKEKFEKIFRKNEETIKKATTIIDGTLEGYYQIAKTFGKHTPFTVEHFARLIDRKPVETKEILEELWLKNKKINHVKGFNDEILYEWDPIGLVTIVSPDMTPEDIPVGAPMLVVIGHSEVRDYLDMDIKAIREQRDLFQKAGCRIAGPWGDFMADDDYLKRNLRLFPVDSNGIAMRMTAVDDTYREAISAFNYEVNKIRDIESIREMCGSGYGEYYNILEPLLKAEFEKLVEDVKKESKKSDKEQEIIAAIVTEYAKFFELISPVGNVQDTIDQIIEAMLNDLDEVKRRIIKEVSTVYDINFQVRVLFANVPVETILYQFINPYEPIEGIRTVAIPKEVAQFRLKKMIPVFLELGIPYNARKENLIEIAKTLGFQESELIDRGDYYAWIPKLRKAYREKLQFSYGGGAQFDNIAGLVEAGYNGAFVARHIYKIGNAVKLAETAVKTKEGLDLLYNFKASEKGPWMPWIKGYSDAGVDLEKVNIFHCVPRLFIDAAMRELRGEPASRLFADAREDASRIPITIDSRGNRSVAIKGVGSNTGILPAEFLASAGVTRVIVDIEYEKIQAQLKNLIDAGITPVVVYRDSFRKITLRCYKEELEKVFSKEKYSKIEFYEENPYPITPIDEVMAVHAEMAFSSEEKNTDTHSRLRGYYEKAEKPEGVYEKITETIKNGIPLYLDVTLDTSEYSHGTGGNIGTITLPMLKKALRYFPQELLGRDAIQENGIAIEFQKEEGRLITIEPRDTFNLGKEPDFENPGFHTLTTVRGQAVVFVLGADGFSRSAIMTANGERGVVVIPASVKEIQVKAGKYGAQVKDFFIPLPERKLEINNPFQQGEKVKNTDILASEETGVIKDYGSTSEEVDVITINGENASPTSVLTRDGFQRPHRLIVKSGGVEIETLDGFPLLDETGSIAVFGPNEVLDVDMNHFSGVLKITSPDGREFCFQEEAKVISITDYLIKRSLFSETIIVEVHYDKTKEEEAVYSTYEMMKKHASLISQKKIDLIVPREMFSESFSAEGSKDEAQKNLDELFGKGAVVIKEYAGQAGLNQKDVQNLLSSSLSREANRTPVLFATESNINAIQPKNYPMCPADLASLLERTKILSIPDLNDLAGKGWLYGSTALRVGILQGCLTYEDIEKAEKGEKTLAQDMKKMMQSVTQSKDIDIADLVLMLSYNEIPTGRRMALQIGDAVALMRMALQRLMIGIPMDRIDRSDWKDRMDKINASP